MRKPLPVMLLPVIETGAVPRLDTVTPIDALPPTGKLPKLTLEGLTPSTPCVPVPLRAMVSGELGALLVIATLPVVIAAVVGAKVTLKEAVWLGLRV